MRSAALVFALALPLAAPASAIDLTGTWEEKSNKTCKGMEADGAKIALNNREIGFADLPISQSGSTLSAYQAGYLFSYRGYAYGEPDGSVGQGILEKCDGDANILLTYRILKAKTFPENAKGVSGKLTALYVYGQPGSSYSCTIQFERTSTADPGPAPPCD